MFGREPKGKHKKKHTLSLCQVFLYLLFFFQLFDC